VYFTVFSRYVLYSWRNLDAVVSYKSWKAIYYITAIIPGNYNKKTMYNSKVQIFTWIRIENASESMTNSSSLLLAEETGRKSGSWGVYLHWPHAIWLTKPKLNRQNRRSAHCVNAHNSASAFTHRHCPGSLLGSHSWSLCQLTWVRRRGNNYPKTLFRKYKKCNGCPFKWNVTTYNVILYYIYKTAEPEIFLFCSWFT
jgi:hypothetical protein